MGGTFRLLWHCGCAYKLGTSPDGVRWNTSAPRHAEGWCSARYTDGSAANFARRERPQLILGRGGEPSHISTAVQPGPAGSAGQGGPPSWTAVAPLLPSGHT